MYLVSTQGVDERMINVHYYYYYFFQLIPYCHPLLPSYRVQQKVWCRKWLMLTWSPALFSEFTTCRHPLCSPGAVSGGESEGESGAWSPAAGPGACQLRAQDWRAGEGQGEGAQSAGSAECWNRRASVCELPLCVFSSVAFGVCLSQYFYLHPPFYVCLS